MKALLFNTKIEEFGDNVVVNGSKAYVYDADKATHFLTFVSTRVKERNGKRIDFKGETTTVFLSKTISV